MVSPTTLHTVYGGNDPRLDQPLKDLQLACASAKEWGTVPNSLRLLIIRIVLSSSTNGSEIDVFALVASLDYYGGWKLAVN